MDPSALHRAAEQLKQTTESHATWHEGILRALVCDDVTEATIDIGTTAHRDCELGRWFYESAPNDLRDHPAFIELGREHHRLHQVAGRLLRAARGGAPIARPDFEDFVATSARMRTQVDVLRSWLDATLAHRDPLTGAHSRLVMLPHLHELRAAVRQGSRPCALVFVDVDELKHVNDAHGHGVGDAVLCAVVTHVQSQLRSQDRIYRYGGDEFLLALNGADLDVALAVATRVRDGLAAHLFVAGPAGVALRVTASFGLALLDAEAPVTESIDRADQALLLAKTAGRNRVIKWDATVQTSTRWRMLDV